jgi:hypothetical protein
VNPPVIFNKLILKRKHEFAGSYNDFEKAIKYCDNATVVKITSSKFMIEANESLGLLESSGENIAVEVEVNESENKSCEIIMSGSFRREHIWIASGFFFATSATIAAGSWKLTIGCLLLWAISQFWFFKVYRWQENAIADNLLKKLRIFELHFVDRTSDNTGLYPVTN